MLYLEAENYTPVDATLIPTEEIQPVRGTPLDFSHPAAIGARIGKMNGNLGGYDHNLVLTVETETRKLAARVGDPRAGRAVLLRQFS